MMGIFCSCLEIKPRLQEHVSVTEKNCPGHGVEKRPIRSSNRPFLISKSKTDTVKFRK